MQIKIKRNYYEATKEILKELKKYYYINTYNISYKDGVEFNISFMYNGELIDIETWTRDDDVVAEVIHALVEANKNIIFN